MTDIAALVERLEKATGPDRELNNAIAASGAVPVPSPGDDLAGFPPHFTASIDAALTLVPQGWWLTLDRYIISDAEPNNPLTWRAWLRKAVGDLDGDGPAGISKQFATAPTPAIALCLAALKARDQQPPISDHQS